MTAGSRSGSAPGTAPTSGVDPDGVASNGAASDRPAPDTTSAPDTTFAPDAPASDTAFAPDTTVAWDSAVAVIAAPLGRLTGAQIVLIGTLLRSGEVIRLVRLAGSSSRLPLPRRPVRPTSDRPANRAAGPATRRRASRRRPGAGQARRAGLLTSDDDALAGVTACSGLACNRAVADVRAAARPLPGHPRTHWAACPRSCGKPRDAEAVIAAGPDSFLLPGQPSPARWPTSPHLTRHQERHDHREQAWPPRRQHQSR